MTPYDRVNELSSLLSNGQISRESFDRERGEIYAANNWGSPPPAANYAAPPNLQNQSSLARYPTQNDPNYQTRARASSHGGLAVTSLVLGILGTVFGIIPVTFFLAFIFGALALIFGLIGWRGKMGKAGTILGLVSIALGIVGVVIVSSAVKDLNDNFGSTTGDSGSGYHVTLGSPSADTFETSVPVSIQNTSSTKTCSFTVNVTANSADGKTQLASGVALVNDVRAGQTARDSAGMLKLVPRGAVYKVGTVDKSC